MRFIYRLALLLLAVILQGLPQVRSVLTLESEGTRNGQIAKCVIAICRKYFPTEKPVLVQATSPWMKLIRGLNPDLALEKEIINTLHRESEYSVAVSGAFTDIKVTKKILEPGSCIIILTEFKGTLLLYMMEKLEQDYWNPRMPFVLVMNALKMGETKYINIFRGLMLFQVMNVVILLYKNTPDVQVYGWLPEDQKDHCNTQLNVIKRLDVWDPVAERLVFDADLYPRKDNRDLTNCKVKIDLNDRFPYTRRRRTERGYIYNGLVPKVFTEAAAAIKLEIEFDSWTRGTPTRIMSGRIAAFGVISLIPSHLELMDYVQVLFRDVIAWYVPVGKKVPQWLGLLKIFQPKLWIFVAASYFAASFAFWVVGRVERFNGKVDRYRLDEILFHTLIMHVGAAIHRKFLSRSSAVLFSVALFYCLQIYTAYQSSLIGFMANPGTIPPIKNVKELNESKYALATTIIGTKGDVFPSADEICMGRTVMICYISCFVRFSCRKDIAVAASETYFRDHIAKTLSYGCDGKYLMLDDVVEEQLLAILFLKGNIIMDRMNTVIMRMDQAGLLDKWMEEILFKEREAVRRKPTFVLSLLHLQGAFYLLMAGLSLSFVAFVLEKLLHCLRC